MKGAIFDLDGTLIDSMEVWMNLLSVYLKDKGYKIEDNLYKRIEGMSLTEAIYYVKERFDIEFRIEDIKNDMREKLFYYYREKFELKEGVREFLELLHEKNIKMCIATATDLEFVLALVKRLDIEKYFEFIQTEDKLNISKLNPDYYRFALERLGLKSYEVWVFEDALYAINSAKAAGFRVCAVIDDAHKAEEEEIIRMADIHINSFKELEVDELWKNY